jgi:UDP-N-acetylmuramoyl-tripeptide--D-alanyl-D-alanine ligase
MSPKELYEIYRQHPAGITTDSRQCPEGSIFLALKGDNFNGNDYAAQAIEKGCALAIVDEERVIPAGEDGKRYILTDDCLQAFKNIAREHRRQFDIPVLAITGTNGKTTTKELVRAVLAKKFNVLATEGNLNNDVGVPKTLLRLNSEHEIAVIEMGASHPGDIKTLAETAEPTCGIITNVGRAHLQGFGSFEGVIKTKGELYDFLCTRDNGLVFLNADDDILVDMLSDELWCTPYSTDPEKQYTCISAEAVPNTDSPLLKLRWRKPLADLEESGESQKWHKVQTNLVGAYNIYNVLAAVAVGINFGVDRKAICSAIEEYKPTNSRSQLIDTTRNRLIVDAYNANPTSMMAALENFCNTESEGRKKMLILGDMRELGDASQEEHQRIADVIAQTDIADVWLVGEEFGKTQNPFRNFPNVEAVKELLQNNTPEGRLILIKGSNGTKLYELPPLL